MRRVILLAASLAAVAATGAVAAPSPTYTVSITGNGAQHQVDHKQNIEDDGECEAAEHVDVTATVAWSASWAGYRLLGRPATRAAREAAPRTDGSRVVGTHVRDACDAPIDEAPPGWAEQLSCDDALVAASGPQLSAVTRPRSMVLSLEAPLFAVPASVQCPLNMRNDQFNTHVVVATKKLAALKRGASLSIPIGTSHPGPGDLYAPDLNCSAPTKPYEGYRTADQCRDQLSWTGTLKITRTS